MPLLWSAGTGSEVWSLFCGCAAGELERVRKGHDEIACLLRAHR